MSLDRLAALAAGDPAAMLGQSACFPADGGTGRTLRHAGRELNARTTGKILAVSRNGRWTGVSLRAVTPAGTVSHPLLLVAATPDGPRILAELELTDPLSRAREQLNRSTFERAAGLLPAEAADELKTLFARHREHAAADRTADPISE